MPNAGYNPLCAVVLTALRVEYQAVRAHLNNLRQEIHKGTVYERGTFSVRGRSWDVGIVETGAGNAPAAVEAERAINYFKPVLVLFVGVAGGLKDVRLGDVVAATKVYGYQSGKANATFQTRPDVGNSTYRLVQRARVEAREKDWLQRLVKPISGPVPRVFVAPIAAGEQVVASTRSAIWKFLRTNYSDAIAVEMEGHGFFQAVHANQNLDALIIRGISDLIDDKSNVEYANNSQEIAAQHASAFAFEVLAKLDVPDVQHDEQVVQVSVVHESQFLSEQFSNLRDLDVARSLLEYKNYLESIRDEFLGKRNLREITEDDIDIWERKLREIVMGIEMLHRQYDLSGYLRSVPKIQEIIWNAIVNLYLASDILQKRSTTRDRQVLYQKLRECPNILSGAIELFKIEAIE